MHGFFNKLAETIAKKITERYEICFPEYGEYVPIENAEEKIKELILEVLSEVSS